MATTLKEKYERGIAILSGTHKRYAEVKYWKKELAKYTKDSSDKGVALIRALYCEHIPKYLHDLRLKPDAFKNQLVLDIGSGPFPSALAFEDCTVCCLDPLWDSYLQAGFPIHIYPQRARLVHAPAENIPFPDHSFDAVISINAIDHVDDIERVAQEIKRVLKPNGKFRMHVHYHFPTTAEPISFDTRYFKRLFDFIPNLHIVEGAVSKHKFGHELTNPNEKYVLWSNF